MSPSGQVLRSGGKALTARRGSRHFEPIEFNAPKGNERINLKIVAKFETDLDRPPLEDTFSLSVFPQESVPNFKREALLIDASGDTAAALRRMKVSFKEVDSINELTPGTLLIIGRSSYGKALKTLRGVAMNGAVEQGVNVLVLEQGFRNVAGITVECFQTRRVFPLLHRHPLLAGLEPKDFIDWRGESSLLPAYQNWNEDSNWRVGANLLPSKHGQKNSFGQQRFWHWSNKGIVSTFCFQKPQLGNYRILLQNGFDCLYTPLVEFEKGRGRILFSQLDLVDHYGKDPVSTRLFHRMLQTMQQPKAIARLPVGFVGDESQKLLKLTRMDAKAGLEETSVALVSLNEIEDFGEVSAFVEDGGTLLVSIPSAGAASLLPVKIKIKPNTALPDEEKSKQAPPFLKDAEIVEDKTEVSDQDDEFLTGEDKDKPPRLIVTQDKTTTRNVESTPKLFPSGLPKHPAFAGLSLSDLYFRQSHKRVPLVESVEGRPADNGLIGAISYGKGTIIYIQPRPEMFEDAWHKTKVIRLYNTILTNLGIRSKVSPDFRLIGGHGPAEEWLPGFQSKVPNLENRPMAEESPLYHAPALNFDPNVHVVW